MSGAVRRRCLRKTAGCWCRAEDTLIGLPIEVVVDMVVLASAVVPQAGNRETCGNVRGEDGRIRVH